MNTANISAASKAMIAGGVIAYPTEACFGLGCDPNNEQAIGRILRIKKRPKGMGLILIADRLNSLMPYLEIGDPSILELPAASWPGPFTWIFPSKKSSLKRSYVMNNSVAVRLTAHPIAAQLCYLFGGAIISTSANRHGQTPIRNGTEVFRIFRNEIDCIVRGAIGNQAKPTQITDAITGKVIRSA